jgi:hypothetical protein
MVHASNAGIEEQRLLVAVHGLQLQPDPTTWLCLQTRESFYRACHLRKSRHVRLTMGIHSCNYNIVPFGNPNDLCDDATELDNLEKRQTPCHVSHNMKQQRRKTFNQRILSTLFFAMRILPSTLSTSSSNSPSSAFCSTISSLIATPICLMRLTTVVKSTRS